MDFRFTPAQDRFRQELREFLARELPSSETGISGESGDAETMKAFSKKLARKGWIGLAWPKEYGGQGLGFVERSIYDEEMTYAAAPVGYHMMAERQMGPSIMRDGSEAQKKFFLPRIVRGECSFCIGYSEPNAGSDLAAVETRAVEDGDDFVINGQKIFTSGAHYADYIWLATRTDPAAPKHKGISAFIVDIKTPGIQLFPFLNMLGGRMNEVVFEDVRVPKTALVGEKNRGWYVIASNLDFERSGIERVVETQRTFHRLVEFVATARSNGAPLARNVVIRNKLADLATAFDVGRLLSYRVAWLLTAGKVPNYEASLAKAYGSELGQRVANVGVNILGLYGQLHADPTWAKLQGEFARLYMLTVSDTIRAGTSEIQRNIIATRGLGLPR